MKLLEGGILPNNHRFSDKPGLQWYVVMIWPIIFTVNTVFREAKERKSWYQLSNSNTIFTNKPT